MIVKKINFKGISKNFWRLWPMLIKKGFNQRSQPVLRAAANMLVVVSMLCAMSVSVVQAAINIDPAGKLKVFGDFRLRAEADERTTLAGVEAGVEQSRSRLRYRVRIGGNYQVNDSWSVNVRMATNISSINSPHITFGDEPDVGFDQAYLNYQHNEITIAAGKQPLNYWNSSEMVWDKDFNPDALSYTHKFKSINLSAAHIILQDNSFNGANDKIEMLQAVYETGEKTTARVTVALGYFNVNDGSAAENIITFSTQYKTPQWHAVIEVSSSDADQASLAYALQLRKNIAGMGFRFYYYYVEAQSIPGDGRYGQDDFPDQNGAGLSNFKGFRVQYDQALDENIEMDLRLYSMQAIDSTFAAMAGPDSPFFSDEKRLRLQLNINLQF